MQNGLSWSSQCTHVESDSQPSPAHFAYRMSPLGEDSEKRKRQPAATSVSMNTNETLSTTFAKIDAMFEAIRMRMQRLFGRECIQRVSRRRGMLDFSRAVGHYRLGVEARSVDVSYVETRSKINLLYIPVVLACTIQVVAQLLGKAFCHKLLLTVSFS